MTTICVFAKPNQIQSFRQNGEIYCFYFFGLKLAKNLFAFSTMLCKRLSCVFCHRNLKVKLFSKGVLQSFRDVFFGLADFGERNSFRMTLLYYGFVDLGLKT